MDKLDKTFRGILADTAVDEAPASVPPESEQDGNPATSALELERLFERATVTGNADKRKLMFSRPSGEICVVTVEESYGERLASLHLEVGRDSKILQGREVWRLFLNEKPFMAFATRDLAMQAFEDSNRLLADTFKSGTGADPFGAREIIRHGAPKESVWREVAKVCAVLVAAVFAVCMAVRWSANLLQTPGEKLAQAREEAELRHSDQVSWGSARAQAQVPVQMMVPKVPKQVVQARRPK